MQITGIVPAAAAAAACVCVRAPRSLDTLRAASASLVSQLAPGRLRSRRRGRSVAAASWLWRPRNNRPSEWDPKRQTHELLLLLLQRMAHLVCMAGARNGWPTIARRRRRRQNNNNTQSVSERASERTRATTGRTSLSSHTVVVVVVVVLPRRVAFYRIHRRRRRPSMVVVVVVAAAAAAATNLSRHLYAHAALAT